MHAYQMSKGFIRSLSCTDECQDLFCQPCLFSRPRGRYHSFWLFLKPHEKESQVASLNIAHGSSKFLPVSSEDVENPAKPMKLKCLCQSFDLEPWSKVRFAQSTSCAFLECPALYHYLEARCHTLHDSCHEPNVETGSDGPFATILNLHPRNPNLQIAGALANMANQANSSSSTTVQSIKAGQVWISGLSMAGVENFEVVQA